MPLVVKRTNLFNFSTGVMEETTITSSSDSANKRCD